MTRRSLLALAAAMVLSAAPQAGQPVAAPRPPVIPAHTALKYLPLRPVEIPQVGRFTLPNGMKLYLLENHELPLIRGFALVRTGNLFDPPDKVGLAEVTGMVMRTGGTANKTGDELDEQLENMAASVETGIGETAGSVSFSALRENADEVLAVFYDVLTSPEFRQEKTDLAKTQLRSAIARRNDSPGGIAAREVSEILYGKDTPYGWRLEYAHLDRIQRDDLIGFYRRYFFPANITLAVYGDFDTQEMKGKLERLFASWNDQQPPVAPFPAVSAKPAPGIYVARKDDVNQTFFQIGHLGGLLNDKDYPALEVMGDILGGGFNSRLFKEVRTKLGYAYSVGAGWGAEYDHPGLFLVSGSTKSESTIDTLKIVRQEIERLRQAEVSAQELESAKQKVLNSFVFNFDTPSKTLNRLVRYEYYGYPPDFIFQYQKAVAAVTPADVLRVARERLRPAELTFVAVGKPEDFSRPLAALGLPVKDIDLTIPEPKAEAAVEDAGSLQKGREALQRIQTALGGAERLASVRDLEQRAVVTIAASEGPMAGMKVQQTARWIAPSQLRQEQELPFGKMIIYFNGGDGWLSAQQKTGPLPPPVKEQLQGDLFRLLIPLLLSDRDSGRRVNLAEPGVLEISSQDGRHMVRVRFDDATAMLLGRTYKSAALQGAPRDVVETLEDWRDVDGIKLPHKITIEQDGAKFAEVAIESIRLNSGIKPEELSRQP